jgi:exosome complex component CSL4
MSENTIFPGDKIASIEEYEAGDNTFDDGDMVRAATVGEKDMNKTTRTISIKHPKLLSIPKVGDVIIGTVAAVMSSMIAVSIDYINGEPTTSKVECVCGTRNLRIRNVALVNDIVALIMEQFMRQLVNQNWESYLQSVENVEVKLFQ